MAAPKRQRRAGAEPKPSREKYYSVAALKRSTSAFCEAWFRWNWGDGDWSMLDYSQERAEWPKTVAVEDEARPIWYRVRDSIREALAFAETYVSDTGGLTAEGLKDMAPLLRRALEKHGNASSSRMIVEPSRTHWLRERVLRQFSDGRRPAEIPVDEIAIYSILAGWWPDSVRPQEGKGASVAAVLGIEKKHIRKAIQQLDKLSSLAAKWLSSSGT